MLHSKLALTRDDAKSDGGGGTGKEGDASEERSARNGETSEIYEEACSDSQGSVTRGDDVRDEKIEELGGRERFWLDGIRVEERNFEGRRRQSNPQGEIHSPFFLALL